MSFELNFGLNPLLITPFLHSCFVFMHIPLLNQANQLSRQVGPATGRSADPVTQVRVKFPKSGVELFVCLLASLGSQAIKATPAFP